MGEDRTATCMRSPLYLLPVSRGSRWIDASLRIRHVALPPPGSIDVEEKRRGFIEVFRASTCTKVDRIERSVSLLSRGPARPDKTWLAAVGGQGGKTDRFLDCSENLGEHGFDAQPRHASPSRAERRRSECHDEFWSLPVCVCVCACACACLCSCSCSNDGLDGAIRYAGRVGVGTGIARCDGRDNVLDWVRLDETASKDSKPVMVDVARFKVIETVGRQMSRRVVNLTRRVIHSIYGRDMLVAIAFNSIRTFVCSFL